MYRKFFGFSERPFQLVPNPAYLYLSKAHEEALAHLTYSISQGDGFVEITGEVGTGKTTLCRVFLECLSKDVEAAFIFNPKLDALQLLKTINDEFGIKSDAGTIKELIDRLNKFLIEKKAEGRKVLLLIDEAQNLTKEVLEQIRLLSNLETPQEKLIQIILVGQPELSDMLDSYELRQLGQRITLSCHLTPLSFKDTRRYISHRIHIATKKTIIDFSFLACFIIYRYSGGVPRLINIAGERSLLTAYVQGKKNISARIAMKAVAELTGRGRKQKSGIFEKYIPVFAVSIFFLSIIFYMASGNNSEKSMAYTPQRYQIKSLAKSEELPKMPEKVKTLETSGFKALNFGLKLWGEHTVDVDEVLDKESNNSFFKRIAAKRNLYITSLKKNQLSLFKNLNIPAILELNTDSKSGFWVLTGVDEKSKVFLFSKDGNDSLSLTREELLSFWSGKNYILWRDFIGDGNPVDPDSDMQSVMALKMFLKTSGYSSIRMESGYDDALKNVISKIQEENGIDSDGISGPLTKICLYNLNPEFEIPRLNDFSG